jgi:hypothetical protein
MRITDSKGAKKPILPIEQVGIEHWMHRLRELPKNPCELFVFRDDRGASNFLLLTIPSPRFWNGTWSRAADRFDAWFIFRARESLSDIRPFCDLEVAGAGIMVFLSPYLWNSCGDDAMINDGIGAGRLGL